MCTVHCIFITETDYDPCYCTTLNAHCHGLIAGLELWWRPTIYHHHNLSGGTGDYYFLTLWACILGPCITITLAPGVLVFTNYNWYLWKDHCTV